MSRETEKVFRKLDAYLAQHEPADEEELNALVQTKVYRSSLGT